MLQCAPTRSCACSHFFSRSPPLCCERFYCIAVYDYVLLTIRVSCRLTAVDKRRFKVRLFSASTTCWYCAHGALARCSHTSGRLPGAQTHRPWPGAPKRLSLRSVPTGAAWPCDALRDSFPTRLGLRLSGFRGAAATGLGARKILKAG